jgi:hypothetical protein
MPSKYFSSGVDIYHVYITQNTSPPSPTSRFYTSSKEKVKKTVKKSKKNGKPFESSQIRQCQPPWLARSAWYVETAVVPFAFLHIPETTGVVDPQLNSAQIKEALGEVAKELAKKKHSVVIVAVGGAINTVLLGKSRHHVTSPPPVE